MPRSRRYRKNQNQPKPEWGKNNPQSKAKNRKTMIILAVITVAVVLIAAFLVVGQNVLFPTASVNPSPSVSPSVSPSASPTVTPVTSPLPSATPLTSPAGEYSANGTQVLLETSLGNITIQLRNDKPITTQNFVNLVKEGFYDGTAFNRVISGFMIQGGQNQTVNVPTISDEIGTDNHNYNGTIAMAKTSAPNSATSQFFINVADNSKITYSDGTTFDGTYTVFGQVISGMNVVMQISQVPVTTNAVGENSQPVQPVTIIKAQVLP